MYTCVKKDHHHTRARQLSKHANRTNAILICQASGLLLVFVERLPKALGSHDTYDLMLVNVIFFLPGSPYYLTLRQETALTRKCHSLLAINMPRKVTPFKYDQLKNTPVMYTLIHF